MNFIHSVPNILHKIENFRQNPDNSHLDNHLHKSAEGR